MREANHYCYFFISFTLMPSLLVASAFYLSTQISCRGSVMGLRFSATAPFTFLFIELTEIQPVYVHDLKTEKPIEDLGGQYWRKLKRVAFG